MRGILVVLALALLGLALSGCGSLDNVSGSATLQGGELNGNVTVTTPLGTFTIDPRSSPLPSPRPTLYPSPSPSPSPSAALSPSPGPSASPDIPAPSPTAVDP